MSTKLPLVLLATLFTAACGATDPAIDSSADDDITLDAKADSFSARANDLVGAFTSAGAKFSQYTGLVLKHDGTFLADQVVLCVRAPCNPVRVTGRWNANRTQLRLGTTTYGYKTTRISNGSIATLSITEPKIGGTESLAATGSFCDATADCAGQALPLLGCMGMHTDCLAHACRTTCH